MFACEFLKGLAHEMLPVHALQRHRALSMVGGVKGWTVTSVPQKLSNKPCHINSESHLYKLGKCINYKNFETIQDY